MNVTSIESLIHWLFKKTQQLDYGKVTVHVIVHGGEIRRIEKVISESKLTDGTPL